MDLYLSKMHLNIFAAEMHSLFWKLKIKFTANYFSVLMVIARAQGNKNNGGTYKHYQYILLYFSQNISTEVRV